jgi:hypothetical protein
VAVSIRRRREGKGEDWVAVEVKSLLERLE